MQYAAQNISVASVEFLRRLPLRHAFGNVAFESRADAKNVRNGYISGPNEAAGAFAMGEHHTVVHAAFYASHVWRECLFGMQLSNGRNPLGKNDRLLISVGGVGCTYFGSYDSKQPAALVFNEEERVIHLFRPMCDATKILNRLRASDYPPGPLRYLDQCEYESGEIEATNNVSSSNKSNSRPLSKM